MLKNELFFKFKPYINWKSYFLSYKYFGVLGLIKLPILVYSKLKILKVGGKIILSDNQSFIKRGMIRIGYFKSTDTESLFSTSIWNIMGLIIIGRRAYFGVGTSLNVSIKGTLQLGSDFHSTGLLTIDCVNNIQFGRLNLLSWKILIMDHDYHYFNNKCVNYGEIKIGNNNWIGCNCIILKDTTLGHDCVVGAGSVVRGFFGVNNALILGNPAKIEKEKITWSR
jgi:acetyltransferase-like isoleucine patch superfamily enzyme